MLQRVGRPRSGISGSAAPVRVSNPAQTVACHQAHSEREAVLSTLAPHPPLGASMASQANPSHGRACYHPAGGRRDTMATVAALSAIGTALVAGAIGLGVYLNAKRAQSTNRQHAAWRRRHGTVQAKRPPIELM